MWNSNMSLRGVFYFASLYRGYVSQNELDIYGQSRIQLRRRVGKTTEEGRKEAIRVILEIFREMDMLEPVNLKKISEKFQMDENQVAEFL